MKTNNTFSDDEALMELIDGYLMGKLSAKELDQFHKRMEKDSAFRKTVMEHKEQMEAVEICGLKDAMDTYHEEVMEERLAKRIYSNWMAIAASIVLILGVSLWFLLSTGNSAQKVFADNFSPDPGLPTTMGNSSKYEFYSGMVSYKQADYGEAILQWEPLYAANPQNDTVVYFLGVAHLANGNPKQAEKYLELSHSLVDKAFPEETNYYLALTYLKENKVRMAKNILKNSSYPSSVALLKQINSIK